MLLRRELLMDRNLLQENAVGIVDVDLRFVSYPWRRRSSLAGGAAVPRKSAGRYVWMNLKAEPVWLAGISVRRTGSILEKAVIVVNKMEGSVPIVRPFGEHLVYRRTALVVGSASHIGRELRTSVATEQGNSFKGPLFVLVEYGWRTRTSHKNQAKQGRRYHFMCPHEYPIG